MSQTKCPKCRNVINTEDRFCPHCGVNLEEISIQPSNVFCSNCGHQNNAEDLFCERCGYSLTEKQEVGKVQTAEKQDVNKIVSKGSYSGTMVKSKSKFWKRLRNTIIIVLVLVSVGLIVWFKVDPEAGEKLQTIGGGLLVMAIFILFVMKKGGRGRSSDNDEYWDHDDDDRDDDDD